MALFKSAEEVYETLGEFFKTVAGTEEARAIRDLNIVIQFVYTQPDSKITFIPTQGSEQHLEVVCGESEVKPDLIFELTADMGNKYWLGKVDLTMALSRQQIRATGPLSKALRVVPLIEPWYGMYEEFLRGKGREDLASA